MNNPFVLHPQMKGRFGVVKLWPEIKAAEDENIARMKRTAAELGLECVEIDCAARMIEPPYRQMTRDDLDFVIHLHFETPKAYDIFSFVALWNPVQFFHDWGYRTYARNLLTHDDFLSCDSPGANHMVERMILNDKTRLGPRFELFHSLSTPLFEPDLGEGKLFYVGINWDRLGGTSRHQEVLEALDKIDCLRIYGPRLFQGVRVWEGYKCYVDELPFDGKSSIEAIHKAGVALVLSSKAHKESALMSNRLFESLAAGAVIICDENPFAQKHFGDTLLYIDTEQPTENIIVQIRKHMAWIKNNKTKALDLARRAQTIFHEHFRLDLSLRKIYEDFPQRKAELKSLYTPQDQSQEITLYLLLPEKDADDLARQLANVQGQSYPHLRPVFVTAPEAREEYQEKLEAVLESPTLLSVPFGGRMSRGEILISILKQDTGRNQEGLFCFVAPNETLFEDHILGLVDALERNPSNSYALSYIIIKYCENDTIKFRLHDKLLLTAYRNAEPSGFARFIFRDVPTENEQKIIFPYINACATLAMTRLEKGSISPRATMIIDLQHKFSYKFEDYDIEKERSILRDLDIERFDALERPTAQRVNHLEPEYFSLRNVEKRERLRILYHLLQSIPAPMFVRNLLRPVVRRLKSIYRRRK